MGIKRRIRNRVVAGLVACGLSLPFIFYFLFSTLLEGSFARTKVTIDAGKTVAPLYFNWKSIAQGGEEPGGRMFVNILPQLKALEPRMIRIDHIYDYYNVVSRSGDGALIYDWSRLDQTVCDIYTVGAKPFFALGYMPPALTDSSDILDAPRDWSEWSGVVQKTIERYSGIDTRLCNKGVGGAELANIYYEVWNEPDLESFGAWGIYDDSSKDYRALYRYAAEGAARARNVQPFKIGGPATTAAYENWFRRFLQYVDENSLRVDFLSWHRYGSDPKIFEQDAENINAWLPKHDFEKYHNLPKIISEWGYDSDPNPATDTQKGAAYTVAVVEKLISQKIEHAFSFEAKDGLNNNFGLLSQTGEKKVRYKAMEILNNLRGYRIRSETEETDVQVIATKSRNHIYIVLVNYDDAEKRIEQIPVTISHVPHGRYSLTIESLGGVLHGSETIESDGRAIDRDITMLPNQITTITLTPADNTLLR